MLEWRKWFDSRLDDAIEAAATQENTELDGKVIRIIYLK